MKRAITASKASTATAETILTDVEKLLDDLDSLSEEEAELVYSVVGDSFYDTAQTAVYNLTHNI